MKRLEMIATEDINTYADVINNIAWVNHGCIEFGICWNWLWFNTKEDAQAVNDAIKLVSDHLRISSDVYEHRTENLFGFRYHKAEANEKVGDINHD